MLLSFSIPEMLPKIRAGLSQLDPTQSNPDLPDDCWTDLTIRYPQHLGFARFPALLKRQTIRRYTSNPRSPYTRALAAKDLPMLDLWWKARAHEGVKLGRVQCTYINRVTIRHVAGSEGIESLEYSHRILSPDGQDCGVYASSYLAMSHCVTADGFVTDTGQPDYAAFRDFFVPNSGDAFNGVLIKW